MTWLPKITISKKRLHKYSSLLIFIIHHYCGMFCNTGRVIVSNMGTLRCTQQAHVNISEKFKICIKLQHFTLRAKKMCHMCAHKKFFSLSHPYIPHVFQNRFWWAENIFRPNCNSSKLKNAQKTTSKKIIIYIWFFRVMLVPFASVWWYHFSE